MKINYIDIRVIIDTNCLQQLQKIIECQKYGKKSQPSIVRPVLWVLKGDQSLLFTTKREHVYQFFLQGYLGEII